jgi:hypothetical protein
MHTLISKKNVKSISQTSKGFSILNNVPGVRGSTKVLYSDVSLFNQTLDLKMYEPMTYA